MKSRPCLHGLLPVAFGLLVSGCAWVPQQGVDVQLPTQAWPAAPAQTVAGVPAPAAVEPARGSIYRADSYRPLFENHRARLVGDILTVQITEKLSAQQRSNSQVDRSGSVKADITSLPLLGANAKLAKLGAGGAGNNSFGGKGSAEASQDFSGTITATVIQVLPNGHLLIAGEKQMGVQASVEVLRFSGQVDPRSIQPGNQVPSTAIANVRLEQRGRGPQAEAQHMGWMSRVFLNVLPW